MMTHGSCTAIGGISTNTIVRADVEIVVHVILHVEKADAAQEMRNVWAKR